MAVESEATEYDSIFVLMAHLINNKDALTVELEEAEQTRDDLVIVVVDLKETIENLKKEKDALDEKIANIKHEKDDLMVVVVDLKETFECVRKEKEVLAERVANIEHERDDLLVVVVDLKETIGEPKIESRPENSQKGKENGNLNCLSAIDDAVELWHRRLGHASFTFLNKLVRKDLFRGLPKSSFKDHKVCDTCVKGKQVRSSFKPKKEVSTSRSLDILHMDLCGPMGVASRGGKKYIFVIVDDYSRFTWTLFLRTKGEIFEVFVAFVKKIQVKMGNNVACIRSDHGTEFDNAKFDEFCTENGITHNFSAPRAPQQMVLWRGKIELLKTWQGQY
uniref:Integrase catalytic domain-containing protein n=1 Tax=Nicotiana tabacum TaxID=4097 RepID=A0A1S4AN98_TOBAC|nr:PREDICTED: uncharacterized protein LOC107799530 [Nicotiana tabacum]